MALEIGFDLAALRASIAEEVGAQLAIELEKVGAGKPKEAKAKVSKVAKRASTPPISAAAQGAKPAPITPEEALADAVAKDSLAKAAPEARSSTKPKAGKKTNQKDKAASPPKAVVSDAGAPPFGGSASGVNADNPIVLQMRVRERHDPKVVWPFPKLNLGTVQSKKGDVCKVKWDNDPTTEHNESELVAAS